MFLLFSKNEGRKCADASAGKYYLQIADLKATDYFSDNKNLR
jgi:hypothetical protein